LRGSTFISHLMTMNLESHILTLLMNHERSGYNFYQTVGVMAVQATNVGQYGTEGSLYQFTANLKYYPNLSIFCKHILECFRLALPIETIQKVSCRKKNSLLIIPIFFLIVRQPRVGHGLLIIEASRSHPDTAHTEGLFWASDHPVAETPT
jgi:hypothetical protein